MRISWTGVGIFFQAGAVNEVNDDSYSITTNYSYPLQYFYSSHLLLFIKHLTKLLKKKKNTFLILYLKMNIAQITPIVILEIRFRKKSYV